MLSVSGCYRINKQQITFLLYLNLPNLDRNTGGNLQKHICIELHSTEQAETSSSHKSLCVWYISASCSFCIMNDITCVTILTLNKNLISSIFTFQTFPVKINKPPPAPTIHTAQRTATMKLIAECEGEMTGWGEFQKRRGNCVRALATRRRKKTTRFLNSADHQSRGIQGQKS